MELKWLEDFLSLAETRSFSRSAEARHVTQSAFSRRIQALELWLGVGLIDRSTYPTNLTPAGRRFRETAEETVRMLHASRFDLRAGTGTGGAVVSVAALHTLSLAFFPAWFRGIEARTGPLGTRLLAGDFHDCLQALAEGAYDFLLTFHHPSVPILLDPDLYPHRVIGCDALVAVHSPACPDAPMPRLAYAPDTFLGRVSLFAEAKGEGPSGRVAHVNAMAEALKAMALEGHGLARVPRSLVSRDLTDGRLVATGADVPLEIRLYRNRARTRAAVEAVWAAAEPYAASA
ncbi:LysR family transcriptional regulator [Methylobacterium gossipiicola]|uniref:DNA-binding transcriptional regulator, LysR family n=1 Tax=Methylobacterium gossipiicola TaxID=582675 RepID=A0A1I2W252_9HYPH|nr:LysR family transcriptional regulator [Methylobacterium gossipiicola]SFG95443.1 DNA-binding transcriptional regulator, LysR family [Methylobacterium gossipiicola]